MRGWEGRDTGEGKEMVYSSLQVNICCWSVFDAFITASKQMVAMVTMVE